MDETVVFHPLETDQLTKIVEIQVERLRGDWPNDESRSRYRRRRFNIRKRGYDPVYGARPLKRLISRTSRPRWPDNW